MSYLFNNDQKSLKERICQINGITYDLLDISNFNVDYDLDILNIFKDKISEYKNLRFLIVGDYDCDGICATTIISRLLDHLGIQNNYYIPSRSKEGYGLNDQIVDNAYNNHFDVIFCVDNGVVAYDSLDKAKKYGLKTMIIDHHEFNEKPDVDAFLHPSMFENKYHDMCAAGLCNLLAQSYYDDDLNNVYGGLASLADMVSVFGYNRYLIKTMMNILSNNNILPIKYLSEDSIINYDSLIYNVIPKINAVSRMEEMLNVNYVVKYLKNNDQECIKYLAKLNEINKTRKDLSKQMHSLACRFMNINDDIIVVKSETFKEGLCGLIANRLLNEYNKPVLIFAINNNELKGSGRSPKGSNFYEYLKNIEGLFNTFGGHAQAVGLSLDIDKYDQMLKYFADNKFEYEMQDQNVLIMEKDDFNLDMLDHIEQLKPFGVDFIEPLYALDNCDNMTKYVISKRFPKYVINESCDAISFNIQHLNKRFNMMIGKVKKDDFNRNKVSLIIEDLIDF